MKKLTAFLIIFALLFSFAACGGKTGGDTGDASGGKTADNSTGEAATGKDGKPLPANVPTDAVTDMVEYFDNMDYANYINVFSYKDENDPSKGMGGDDFVGKELVKEGTFAKIYDKWSDRERYYVWGYADQTRCCDFQWEFVPENPDDLPNPGARVELKGTLEKTQPDANGSKKDAALDGYWFTNTTLTVLSDYTQPEYDYDLTRCSPTLGRVQILNMENFADDFNGKTLLVYGRALNGSCIQHPYYNNDTGWGWTLDFKADKTPATGQYLILGGTFEKSGDGCLMQVSSYTEES